MIDYDGETNLFHFYLLRSVGKGAFGKVRSSELVKTRVLSLLSGEGEKEGREGRRNGQLRMLESRTQSLSLQSMCEVRTKVAHQLKEVPVYGG